MCTFNLFAKLGGTPDPGGEWEQVSGPQTVPITGGYLGSLDMCAVAHGDYVFEYWFNEIDSPASVTVTVGGRPDAGSNTAISTTEGASVITLIDQLDGTPDVGGTWTVDPPIPNGTFDGNAGTYDPAAGDGSESGTVYAFTYEVVKPGTDGDCECCTVTSVLTITVYLGGNVGSDAAIEVCATEPVISFPGESIT